MGRAIARESGSRRQETPGSEISGCGIRPRVSRDDVRVVLVGLND